MNARIRATIEQLCGIRYDDTDSDTVFTGASPTELVTGQPPYFLFLLAEDEELFPHRYVRQFADRLAAAGGTTEMDIIADTRHGFMMAVDSAPAKYGFSRMLALLHRTEPPPP